MCIYRRGKKISAFSFIMVSTSSKVEARERYFRLLKAPSSQRAINTDNKSLQISGLWNYISVLILHHLFSVLCSIFNRIFYCLNPTPELASRCSSGSKFSQVGCCVMDRSFPKGTLNGPIADVTA